MKSELYFQPTAMEPLLPTSASSNLADLTCEILRKAGALAAQLPSPTVQTRVANIVTEMNSYYSNLIEGHKTLPKDIELAMQGEYSGSPEKRANQVLSRAHIEVERLMSARLAAEPSTSIHSPEFLCWLHHEFYSRLPDELHFSESKSGKKYCVSPGMLRDFEVSVGSHQPPHHRALPQMLERFGLFYESADILSTQRLVALAAAHHRLAWIHPFADGNGRIARLYSHASLIRCKADGSGLWTLSRGLARQRKEYYERLGGADQTRWNDLDGRGNLSDRGLAEFCVFMLKVLLDQIEFMSDLLQLKNLSTRMERHLLLEIPGLEGRMRERLARLLKAALLEGEIERGRVGDIVGLSGTASREVIRFGIKEQLIDSETEKGPLSLVFSSKTLESYFPKLFQDLPVNLSPS